MRFILFFFSFYYGQGLVAQEPPVPKILVHGGGPNFAVNMRVMERALYRHGVGDDDILRVQYDYRESIESVSQVVRSQIMAFVGRYPKMQQFDIITHSLGNFIAMHALVNAGLEKRVRKYIGLAGVGLGQNSLPLFCAKFACPEYMMQLSPHRSDFAQKFWLNHSDKIGEWQHCALFSYSDRRVKDPYDAGVLAPGTGYPVEGISHLGFVKNRRGTELMIDYCYDGSLD